MNRFSNPGSSKVSHWVRIRARQARILSYPGLNRTHTTQFPRRTQSRPQPGRDIPRCIRRIVETTCAALGDVVTTSTTNTNQRPTANHHQPPTNNRNTPPAKTTSRSSATAAYPAPTSPAQQPTQPSHQCSGPSDVVLRLRQGTSASDIALACTLMRE